MKVVREGYEKSKKSFVNQIILPEPEIKAFSLSLTDIRVLRSSDIRFHYSSSDLVNVAQKMLDERHKINELTISKSDRVMEFNQLKMYVKPKLYEQLNKEAEKLRISLNDYIRGIIYSRGNQIISERIKKRKEIEQRKHENRVITFSVPINKEMREKLYEKYGNLNDRLLEKAVRPDILNWLNGGK